MTLPSDILKALKIATRHLSGEAIAAFIGNALADDERKAANSHLATCPQCRERLEVVAEATAAADADALRVESLAMRLAATNQSSTEQAVPLANSLAGIAGRGARNIVNRTRDWVGSLGIWSPRLAAAGAPMKGRSSADGATYAGVEAPLETLFSQEVLTSELGWTKGVLSLTAAYNASGQMTDLRAAVGCGRQSADGAPIIVRVGQQGTEGVTLVLTQNRPAEVHAAPPLEGLLGDMTVSVSVGAPK